MTGPAIRRVAVVGTSGSGKSTFAAALAAQLGVPHVELDAHFWLPDWQEPDRAEFATRVGALLGGLDGWVVDGNYGALGVTDETDTIVWLDLPLRTCLWRTIRRTARRARRRELLWGTNRERWTGLVDRKSLTWWVLTTHRRRRREYATRFAGLGPDTTPRLLRFRSTREATAWLAVGRG